MVEGDQLSAAAIGAFVDKNVADGKTVTISEITLTGADAANYVLAGTGNQPDTTADITAKALTLADGTVKVTKVYDGTTAAGTLTGELALTDAIENDTVSVNMTGVTGECLSRKRLRNLHRDPQRHCPHRRRRGQLHGA